MLHDATNLENSLRVVKKVKNTAYPINAGEGVEKREPSYTVGGNAN